MFDFVFLRLMFDQGWINSRDLITPFIYGLQLEIRKKLYKNYLNQN